jgi:hypothetical protein
LNDPYEKTETHLRRLLGRAFNSFDLPDTLVERLDSALAHASSLCSAYHGAGLHRETYRHAYLLPDGSALTLWELVHNTGREGTRFHELYVDEAEAQLAASRLSHPGESRAPGPAAPHDTARLSARPFPDDLTARLLSDPDFGATTDIDAEFALLGSLLAAPPAPLPRPRTYVPDNSPDHARRVLRRAENANQPGEETAQMLRTAFAHHITQVFGRQCQISGKDAGFMLYEHAFLLIDGTETSLWEVEHTATPDGRHMCEVYASECTAREAMELRARVL